MRLVSEVAYYLTERSAGGIFRPGGQGRGIDGAGRGHGDTLMRPSNDLPEVYLCREAVDFRKGINGLAALVEEELALDPFSEILFVFCNRRRNRVRILYWECNGFCLWMKRLEKDRFKWPRRSDKGVITLNGQQLNWLLDGYHLNVMKPVPRH